MFQPFRLRDMTLANRVVVSPMCQYSRGRRHADRLAPGALRRARHRRRRPDVHRDDLRVGATRASRHGCTGMYNDAQEAAWKRIVDFVHAQFGGEVLPAARPCRPQGRDQADVGGHRRAAAGGRAGRSCRPRRCPIIPHSQVPREMTRADMDAVDRRLRAGGEARRARGLRHARAARRPRLSAGELHLAAHQQAHRRIRRRAREPPALPARSVPRHARGLAGRQADVGAHLGDRLDGRRAHRRRRGRGGARLRRGRLRPDRRLDRPDRAGRRAGLRPHVPDAVLRPDPQRRRARHHVRRRHHQRRPGQHHHRRRPRRPRGAGAAASGRSVVHACEAAAWYGADGDRTARRNISPAAISCSATARASARN